MKLNYRDRIIIGVLLALVLLLGGFFLLVKPTNEDIKTNKATLSTLEQSKAEVDAKRAEIPGLKTDIKESYQRGIKLTETFVDYNNFNNPRKLDQYMQDFATENEVKIMSLQADEMSSESLSYYYFTPTFVADEMLKQADINGAQAAINAEEMAESNALADRTAENVIQANYTITVTAEEKENIWNYMKALEEQEETILIKSVALQNIVLKENENASEEEEGEKELVPGATFNITLYSVYQMDEPNVEMSN